jgi:hypothetical protein
MSSLKNRTKWLTIACLVCVVFCSSALASGELVTLEEYGEGDKQFEVFDIGDKMVVYFHQRMLGDAIVEKNYIVYQFDKATGELLNRRSHWRTDLPDEFPDIMIDYQRLRMSVDREIQSARLWIISPESDIFPLDPCPRNPCWVVRLIKDGNLIIEIIDAVTGEYLGNGIPPPYTAFSLTGPIDFNPCDWSWESWSLNAETWFNAMGYSTQQITWPTENQVKAHVQSNETALFYELAHGGSTYFQSGCVGGMGAEYTYAHEIDSWMGGYTKMPFTFIGSCDGLCSTGDGTFAYEFRKGSPEDAAVVGYCGMSTPECATCWSYSLDWQDDLFYYMSLGWSVKDAFDQANANYPTCMSNSCMRFSGDQTFAVIPRVQRVPGPCTIIPLDIDFGELGVGCYRDTTFCVKNKDIDTISVDLTESCDHYDLISNGGLHTLAPGESVIVTVRFEPTVTGTHDCTIDTGPAGCSNVTCTGIGNNGCSVYPRQLDFGSIAMGDSVDLDFTIYNVGCDTLFGSVSAICLDYEIASGAGSYSIPVGDSLVVTVRFKPNNLGTRVCTIQTGTKCMNVSCTGVSYEPPPACLIEPDTLDFGAIDVLSFDMKTFDITNTGYGTLVGVVTSPCPNFSVINGDYSLTHDESKTVTILFYAATSGFQECTIETGNDACVDLYCMGYGSAVEPECLVDPDTLDFGTVLVGGYSDMDFIITNTGADTLSGSVSETCDHYTIISGAGAYALAADETVTVMVRFEPTIAGNHTCSIETGSGLCSDVFCTGDGLDPALCIIDPDTLDYGTVTLGDSLDMAFIISNGGGDTLTGDVSETCDHFSIASGAGGYALAADETLTVTVRYKPGSIGLHECTIETGSALCTDVYCSGTGESPPLCVVEPDTLDYGIVIVTDSLDMNFDIINTGGGVLAGTVSDTCSYFDVVAGGGSYGLAAGETLHVTVRFKPEADGSFECWVETGADCGDVYCMGDGDDVSGLRIVDAKRFFLYQNYPNPFNPVTNITFTVPGKAHTSLSIYNIEGRLVKTLVNSEFSGGVKTVTWNGTDSNGNQVSSGVYFYRLRAGDNVMTKKMILLK